MGFRIEVGLANDRNIVYGNDHKLYGYVAYESVKSSFDYIHKFIKEQWNELWENDTADDAYSIMCGIGMTDELILSAEEFKSFAELYLADARLAWNDLDGSLTEHIKEYMHKLADMPGDKVVNWG